MTVVRNRLSDTAIRGFKPAAKLFKRSDGAGLELWVFPEGAKRWRLAYRHGGKRKLLALGSYPAISLADARRRADDARRLVAEGIDPTAHKRERAQAAATAAFTFGDAARELVEKKRREGRADATLSKLEWLLGLAASLRDRPVSEITSRETLDVLRKLETQGLLETASRLRGRIGEVFRYAIATRRADIDPTAALRGAIARPRATHRAAITDPKRFGELLRAFDGYQGSPEVRAALRLSALLFARPGELRAMEWAEVDLDKAVWEIPAHKMKMRRPHRVPLCERAAKILYELKPLTGGGRYVFPGARSALRPLSENALNAALRTLGFTSDVMCAHGFRASAASMLNESGRWNPDAIEAQLAHQDKSAVRRAYARSDYWAERIRMMQWWADECEALAAGERSNVVPLKRA
jgi:integrase